MKYIYLDTCSINYIHDNMRDDEKRKWREKTEKELMGEMVFSPVSLFEILNSKTERKDELIHTCQLLFDDRLLPRPTIILDKYVEQGCPKIEKGNLDLKSDSIYRDVWQDVSSNLDKTIFVHDMANMNSWSNFLKRFINKTPLDPTDDSYEIESTVRMIIDELSSYFDVHDDFKSVSLFFIVVILLLGALPFDSPESFWQKRNISRVECKLNYLVQHCRPLLHRGPIATMSLMAIRQVESGKSTRGLFNDCLHIGYTAYCSFMISNDKHFLKLGNEIYNYMKCMIVGIAMDKDNVSC